MSTNFQTSDSFNNSNNRKNKYFRFSNDYQVDVFDFDGGCVTYYVEADSYEEAAANAEALAYGDGITDISHMNTYRV